MDSSNNSRGGFRKYRLIVYIVIAVILLALIKIFFFPAKKPAAPQGAKGPTPAVPVNVYVVRSEKLSNVVYASGTVTANEELILRPELAGKIVQLNISEGNTVSKGTLLLKINDADLQAQLKKLNIQLKLASDREQRAAKLFEAQGISRDEYEEALNQVNSIKADMDFTRAQIAKTEIRAPFNGVIGLKYVSDGSYVTPTTNIASFQQVDPLKLDFSLPERYASRLEKEAMVKFSVSGVKDTVIGYVYAVEPRIDPSTRSIQVRALCPNKSVKIFPGAFARVQVILKETPEALMIPTQAIVPILKGQKVYLAKGGKVVEAKVETGLRTESQIQVTSGLSSGDSVITTGIMSLRPGMSVKVK